MLRQRAKEHIHIALAIAEDDGVLDVFAANEAAQRFMQTDVEFLSARLILNYMYLTVARLGVSPMEKFFLAYLIARSVEEMHSLSTIESIKAYSDTNVEALTRKK